MTLVKGALSAYPEVDTLESGPPRSGVVADARDGTTRIMEVPTVATQTATEPEKIKVTPEMLAAIRRRLSTATPPAGDEELAHVDLARHVRYVESLAHVPHAVYLDYAEVAVFFNVKLQTAYLWAHERNRALRAGQKPGPNALPGVLDQKVYPMVELFDWGVQTGRCDENTGDPIRLQPPGKALGSAPAEPTEPPFDRDAKQREVVEAFIAARGRGAVDRVARREAATAAGLTGHMTSRLINEAHAEADKWPGLAAAWPNRSNSGRPPTKKSKNAVPAQRKRGAKV